MYAPILHLEPLIYFIVLPPFWVFFYWRIVRCFKFETYRDVFPLSGFCTNLVSCAYLSSNILIYKFSVGPWFQPRSSYASTRSCFSQNLIFSVDLHRHRIQEGIMPPNVLSSQRFINAGSQPKHLKLHGIQTHATLYFSIMIITKLNAHNWYMFCHIKLDTNKFTRHILTVHHGPRITN